MDAGVPPRAPVQRAGGRHPAAARRQSVKPRLLVWIAVLAVLVPLLACCFSGAQDKANDSALVDIGAGLSGPKGAAATVVASGLPNVSGLAEDLQGRLWVVTAAFNDVGTDGLYVVTSAGVEPVKVIGDLHTPMGLLWIGERLYVSSAEGVLAFDGFDGAHFANEQTIATFDGAGIFGGLVLGGDGRIRVGISAPCDGCEPATKWAAAVVSFLPDGTGAEVETSGIRAPVGLAYIPGTNSLLMTMNQRDDLGDATPGDYLAVAEKGEDWGFPGCYGQGGDACDGVPEPVAELDKHAAVSGVAVTTRAAGPAAYLAEWATGKVLVIPLTDGSGDWRGKASTFLTGLRSPVAVIASGNSSLLVGDWASGKVYRIDLPANPTK